MVETNKQSGEVIFLGLAEFVEDKIPPFPIGGIDLFQLALHKWHIIYPGIIASNEWIVLVRASFLKRIDPNKWSIHISDENNIEFGALNLREFEYLEPKEVESLKESPVKDGTVLLPLGQGGLVLLHFKLDTTIPQPGRYILTSNYDGIVEDIGSIYFHYQRSPSLTPDQVKAIESDPNSAKAIGMVLGCKFCDSKLKVYAGLMHSEQMQDDGFQWYSDIHNRFMCECGKTNYSLEYIKESMHGLLLKDFSVEASGLSYVRRYGHQQVSNVVNQFRELVRNGKYEEPVQKFLEDNPILLSRFSAKRLFVKPDILGKFVTDFVVLDSKNQLWFIELEKPSLQLFKKDSHPTSGLMHSYEQVNDWLQQYGKYSGAVLSSLGLKEEDIVAVRGAIIAGRSSSISHEVLQRHLSNPPYPAIEFMTLDDLAASLLTISRKLA